tara:strand:- start:598 stop:918 length:321 start_codon:yes stop_codon:yes gene_type:complete
VLSNPEKNTFQSRLKFDPTLYCCYLFHFIDAGQHGLHYRGGYYCSNTNCTSATTIGIDTGGNVGDFSQITIGTDGLGLISYLDMTNLELKVAHCANQFCSPYSRRR